MFAFNELDLSIFQRDMRHEDQILAKKLIYISNTLRDVRLDRVCDEHRIMLDDTERDFNAAYIMDNVVKSFCEFPSDFKLAPSLKSHGITKSNILGRRFSVL